MRSKEFKQCIQVAALFVGVWVPQVLADAAPVIQVSQAWVRGLPPGQSVTAAFMRWQNVSGHPLELKQLSSPWADHVELHAHHAVDGQMKMRPVKHLTLAPGEKFDLQPGGYHVMIFGLHHALNADEPLPLKICFDRGCVLTKVPVVSIKNEHKHIHRH